MKGPEEVFTGDIWFAVIAKGEEPSRMRVNAVHFAPRASPTRMTRPEVPMRDARDRTR